MYLFNRNRHAADAAKYYLVDIDRPQELTGTRFYGRRGTIRGTRHLHVETHHGTVVAVWFRCQMLPFQQVEVNGARATEMESVSADELPRLEGVEVTD